MSRLNILKSIIKNKLGAINYPSFVTFIVTWRCNGRCIFCDVWKKRAAANDELGPEEIADIFRQLKPIDVLRLSGGEPFLRGDLAEIINKIEETNPPGMIHITTNGILTGPILKTVAAIKPLRKLHIKISIDEVGEKHDKMRGVPGAFDAAMRTVKELVGLKKTKTNFHIGVNQVIVGEKEIDSYFALKKILDRLGVPIYPVIANEPTNSLYSDQGVVDPSISFKPFGNFSPEKLKQLFKILIEHGKEVGDFKERMVDRYHLTGLYNRLIKKRNKPNPRCVALNNHLRIMPNGDIPVCLYNGTIIGNLKHNNFKNIWFGPEIKKCREWVRKCPGCWQSCETAVNAVYTGDIIKGLFY